MRGAAQLTHNKKQRKMEIFFQEVTNRHSGKRFCFKIDRLKSFEEKDGYTKIHLDTASFEIAEEYQEFIEKLKTNNKTK